jgi:hypothetical protein
MACLLDITDPEHPETKRWINLDNAFLINTMEVKENDSSTTHVVITTVPGGTGQILPAHITLDNVVELMQLPVLTLSD